MSKKSLLSKDTFQEVVHRINQLSANSKPQWGKLSPAQMLAHCSEVQEVANGTKALKGTSFFIKVFKGLIKAAVFNEKPYPKGSKTHPQYIVKSEKDFETEKKRLTANLNYFVETIHEDIPHPFFGYSSKEDKAWAYYKHLDHHLKQFGV